MPALPSLAPAPAKRGFLSTRDWLMMGIGAGSVILAGVLGFVLAQTVQ